MATLRPLLLLPISSLVVFLLLSLSPSHVSANNKPVFFASVASPNPFTAKAALLRYWNRKIPSTQPRPDFLVSKLSPLSALDSATYSSLAAAGPDALSARLPGFCAAARLLCTPALRPSLASHPSDSNFVSYQYINFTNYGTGRGGGLDSFKNYSDGLNVPTDTFRRYSRDSTGHNDSFAFYSPSGNVVTDNFTSYATSATGGASDFAAYERFSNVPNLKFTNYDANSNSHDQQFTSYSDDTNAGGQTFSGYGKHGNGVPNSFNSYANNSNVINSGFSGYGEDGNGAADTFISYADNGNVPENTFRAYGENGNGGSDTFISYADNGNVPENTFRAYGENGNSGSDTFASYRDQSNVGDDTFKSYAKGGTGSVAGFVNYGASFNIGSDNFTSYGEGALNPNITFKSYSGDVTNFKAYAKTGVDFKTYKNSSAVPHSAAAAAGIKTVKPSGGPVKNRWVEPGKFFRESSLRKGTVMPMPDIQDKMPSRSFLPRSIAGRIPFSAAEVQRVFGIPADTALGKGVSDTVSDCVRPPSRGETKRCATSAEDVIDFAVTVLGGDAVVRSTESAGGSKGNILIGDVTGVDGGKVTRSVSCHQSLFPYLVYYCHSVPKVRVYEAEILSVHTKEKINHGVAICHLDTSDWSAGHGAFVALGSTPGKIEVCHWIFQGDMTWTVAN